MGRRRGFFAEMAKIQRDIERDQRRREREAAKRQRDLARQQAAMQKAAESERVAWEVAVHENLLDRLVSIHRDRSNFVDWRSIAKASAPPEPTRNELVVQNARLDLEEYRPGCLAGLFGLGEKQRRRLEERVSAAHEDADRELARAQSAHAAAVGEWREQTEFALKVVEQDVEAWLEVFGDGGVGDELGEVGISADIEPIGDGVVVAKVDVHGASIVPEVEIKQLKSGKKSEKQMPRGKRFGIYQDYVCGVALRVANEVFGMVPAKAVVVTCVDDLLNPATGHLEQTPILSVAIPRATLERLNLQAVDPSDAMENFVHEMSFKKTTGFAAVSPVDPSSLAW